MSQQRCPECHSSNPGANRYCAQCGAPLARDLVVQPRRALVVPNERRLALPTARQAGQAVAVSVAAFALEHALAWLRRRRDRRAAHPQSRAIVPRQVEVVESAEPRPTVTIRRQRILQVWRNGVLTEQLVEGEHTTID